MTTTPSTLTYSLEEVLFRFEQKMDRQFAEVNQKMDRQFVEVNQKMDRQFVEVSQKMDRQSAEVNQKFVEVNQKLEKIDGRLNKLEIGQAELSGEIKTLDEKVSGISKRLDNQEFISRGILVSVIIALLGGAAKLFDLLPLNKS
jgi:predicted nuclease with TOPRIM domain